MVNPVNAISWLGQKWSESSQCVCGNCIVGWSITCVFLRSIIRASQDDRPCNVRSCFGRKFVGIDRDLDAASRQQPSRRQSAYSRANNANRTWLCSGSLVCGPPRTWPRQGIAVAAMAIIMDNKFLGNLFDIEPESANTARTQPNNRAINIVRGQFYRKAWPERLGGKKAGRMARRQRCGAHRQEK